MNTELSFKEAKKWSILAWEYRVKNGSNLDKLIEKYPILESLRNNCGFCEKYTITDTIISCGKCPLVIDGNIGCTDFNHPYLTWSKNQTSSNTLIMLELIRKTKDPDKKE